MRLCAGRAETPWTLRQVHVTCPAALWLQPDGTVNHRDGLAADPDLVAVVAH